MRYTQLLALLAAIGEAGDSAANNAKLGTRPYVERARDILQNAIDEENDDSARRPLAASVYVDATGDYGAIPRLIVVCDDGSVCTRWLDGSPWREEIAVPGTPAWIERERRHKALEPELDTAGGL